MTDPEEVLVSVDVETAGPVPGRWSLLAIGACLVDDPDRSFYVELRPESGEATPEALAVSGLSMETLRDRGAAPAEALAAFARWVDEVAPPGHRAVFVGFNAPFDWMFVAEAFHRHLGRNPFGHSALDIKSYAMGRLGGTFADTSLARLVQRIGMDAELPHHALEDARIQAEVLRRLRAASSPA
ncbi:MAG: exonuclease domain-containing protein [Actinomycetota bacterium]